MTESQVVNRWIEKARADEKLETTRELLLRVARRRFQDHVSSHIVQTINSQPNLSLLQDWVDAASTADSFAQFLAVLRR